MPVVYFRDTDEQPVSQAKRTTLTSSQRRTISRASLLIRREGSHEFMARPRGEGWSHTTDLTSKTLSHHYQPAGQLQRLTIWKLSANSQNCRTAGRCCFSTADTTGWSAPAAGMT